VLPKRASFDAIENEEVEEDARHSKTALALVSSVSSLASLVVGFLLGLLYSRIARKKMRESHPQRDDVRM